MFQPHRLLAAAALVTLATSHANAQIYLNDTIISVALGASMGQVGTLLGVTPALGGAGGNPIFAESIPLSFPSQVRFVNAVLSGTNGQVDFNNLGFTGALSPGLRLQIGS